MGGGGMEMAPLSMRNWLSTKPLDHGAMWPRPQPGLPAPSPPQRWLWWSPAAFHAAAVDWVPPLPPPHHSPGLSLSYARAWLLPDPAFTRTWSCLQPWVLIHLPDGMCAFCHLLCRGFLSD